MTSWLWLSTLLLVTLWEHWCNLEFELIGCLAVLGMSATSTSTVTWPLSTADSTELEFCLIKLPSGEVLCWSILVDWDCKLFFLIFLCFDDGLIFFVVSCEPSTYYPWVRLCLAWELLIESETTTTSSWVWLVFCAWLVTWFLGVAFTVTFTVPIVWFTVALFPVWLIKLLLLVYWGCTFCSYASLAFYLRKDPVFTILTNCVLDRSLDKSLARSVDLGFWVGCCGTMLAG